MKTKTKKTKKDNPNSKYWLHKADAEWGKLIHATFPNCIFLNLHGGCAGKLEAHHNLSRARRYFRHDPMNGVILCSKHHQFDTMCSPHGSPLGYSDSLKAVLPAQYEWAWKNKWSGGPPNYKEAYEKLVKLNAGQSV